MMTTTTIMMNTDAGGADLDEHGNEREAWHARISKHDLIMATQHHDHNHPKEYHLTTYHLHNALPFHSRRHDITPHARLNALDLSQTPFLSALTSPHTVPRHSLSARLTPAAKEVAFAISTRKEDARDAGSKQNRRFSSPAAICGFKEIL